MARKISRPTTPRRSEAARLDPPWAGGHGRLPGGDVMASETSHGKKDVGERWTPMRLRRLMTLVILGLLACPFPASTQSRALAQNAAAPVAPGAPGDDGPILRLV